MNLLMKYLLKTYNSLNDSIKKNLGLMERKWKRILDDNNIMYINAHIFEHGYDPHKLELDFVLNTNEELTLDERELIENEACCKLTNHDKEISMAEYAATGKCERYYYTFTPLKIISSPVDESWLKD